MQGLIQACHDMMDNRESDVVNAHHEAQNAQTGSIRFVVRVLSLSQKREPQCISIKALSHSASIL